MVCGCGTDCPSTHTGQRVVVTVWRPHLHSTYFPFVKRVVVTLRMGCAHLCALDSTERSLAWPIWGGDVVAYVGPLWEFLPVQCQ